jgi:tetratricopeptide (TPR) repeat protein
LVLAAAEVRNASDRQVAAGEALNLLEIAEHIRGVKASRALLIERARYLSLQKQDALAKQVRIVAAQTPAETAYDLYMLACTQAWQETPAGWKDATDLLTRSINLDPTHYWAHFERAMCRIVMKEWMLAATDLGTCIGLWPESSWAHFNLGYVLDLEGRKAEAADAFTKAIEFAPEFRSAYLNRGLARLELHDFEGALKDFDKVVRLGRSDAVIAASRAMALEGLGRDREADQEFGVAMERSRQIPGSPIDRISWTYGMAVAHRAPAVARQAFEETLKRNPKHPQALYGQGMLAMHANDLAEAIRWFDKSINADSKFMEPLRYRAIALARSGQLKEAATEADILLTREDTNPQTLYTAACVLALTARKTNDPELIEEAVRMLRLALIYLDPKDHVAFLEKAASDDDLSALRQNSEFRNLTAPAGKKKPQTLPARDL